MGGLLDIFNDERKRGIGFQVLAVLLVAGLGYTLWSNMAANLARNNVTSGFGFLGETSGFAINQTLIPYSESSSYFRAFLVGLTNTLVVAFIGIVIATVLGFLIGIARLSKNPLISGLATTYIEIFRNIPLLLQLFFWYFAVLRALPKARDSLELGGSIFLNNRGLYLPATEIQPAGWLFLAAVALLTGLAFVFRQNLKSVFAKAGESFPASPRVLMSGALFIDIILIYLLVHIFVGDLVVLEYAKQTRFNLIGGARITPEFIALLLALSVYTAAFIAEIVRAGIKSVAKGQWEAGQALGLSRTHILRYIILPQALRVIIPPLTSQFLNLTKNSSLAVAIAYPDLVSVFSGIVLNQTGQAVEVILMTMAVYLTLSLLTAAGMNWFNAKMAIKGR